MFAGRTLPKFVFSSCVPSVIHAGSESRAENPVASGGGSYARGPVACARGSRMRRPLPYGRGPAWATLGGLLLVLLPCAEGAGKTYDFQRKVLDNGLTVVSLEDHSCPIVAVQVWYHVGSKDEDPERQASPMFEHMMFRDDRLGSEDHFEHPADGGDCNAYTASTTRRMNELPSNQLEPRCGWRRAGGVPQDRRRELLQGRRSSKMA